MSSSSSEQHENQQRRKKAMSALSAELKARKRAEKAKPLSIVAGVLVPIVAGCALIYYAVNSDDSSDTTAASTSTTSSTSTNYQPISTSRDTALAPTVNCVYNETGSASRDISLPQTENISTEGTVTITLQTNQGDIPMVLDRSVSPCTVNAIEHLAQEGYYNDTVCHRITTNGIYVLQCGDPSGTGSGGPGFQFANEYPTDSYSDTTTPILYTRGTIAMANAGADTNGSQFFLNYEDSPLPPNYTYFGEVTEEGLETLDKIAANGVEGGATDGAPAQEVRIEEALVSS